MSNTHVTHDHSPHDPRQTLPLDSIERLEGICDKYEHALRRKDKPNLTDYLPHDCPALRVTCFRELLALELEYRLAQHEHPKPQEYEQRFSEFAYLLPLLFSELNSEIVVDNLADTEGGIAKQTSVSQSSFSAEDLSQQSRPPGLLDHPRYRLVRLLGRGGMGAVYLAEHRIMQRPVALKLVRPEWDNDPTTRERFHREIKAAASLHHPNIVTAYDAEQLGAIELLVMEYVEGIDLARFVAREGALSIQQACNYVRQAACGLQHAHRQGMVHRDVKPHNLMLIGDGQIKILDFGLAQFRGEATETTRSGVLLGSIDYMAPEQASNPRTADIRADIYSLGCTLYFLLTGKALFHEGSLWQKIKAHAETPPPRLSQLPEPLQNVLQRMLAKDPVQRYQEPQEVVAALEPFSSGHSHHAAIKVVTQRLSHWTKNYLWSGAIGLAFICLLVGTLLIRPSSNSPELSPQASQLYEQAQRQLNQRQEKLTRDAIRRLREAIGLAPNSAKLHAALATAYILQGDYGWEMADEVFPLAKANAVRALEFDPQSSEAHLAQACVLDCYERDISGAEQEYRRVLTLDPKFASGHHWYAWFLLQQERLSEAEQEIDAAARLGVTQAVVLTNVGRIRYFAGSYRVAVEKFEEAVQLEPHFDKAYLDLAMTYAELDQLADALQQFMQTTGLTEDGRDVTALLAYTHARCGNSEIARGLLRELEIMSQSKPLAYEIATIYSALDDQNAAMSWLRKAFHEHSIWRCYVKIDPRLAKLRRDARWKALVDELVSETKK